MEMKVGDKHPESIALPLPAIKHAAREVGSDQPVSGPLQLHLRVGTVNDDSRLADVAPAAGNARHHQCGLQMLVAPALVERYGACQAHSPVDAFLASRFTPDL
jgi:hypothetical protein